MVGRLNTGHHRFTDFLLYVVDDLSRANGGAGDEDRLGVITDMPLSAGFGFVGQTNFGGNGGKVLFDIQERHLVVYPFTETIKDGDNKWHRRKIRNYWDDDKSDKFVELYVGNPVAMFPIQSERYRPPSTPVTPKMADKIIIRWRRSLNK